MTGEVMRRSSVEEVVGDFCGSSVLAGPGLGSDSDLHVLAVDDSLVDRKVIERLLRISSCRVTTVDSGMRALQYLRLDGEDNTDGINDLKINLIMTDYSMPGMTGYELLKKIKGSMTFREVPVVIMSSENVLTRVDRCLEEGAEDFLMKPVKLSDVKRLKEFVMRGEIEETGNRRVVKRKLQDDIVPSSSPSDFSSLQIPAFEAAMSKIPSLTPPSSILPKKPKLQRGESPSPFI